MSEKLRATEPLFSQEELAGMWSASTAPEGSKLIEAHTFDASEDQYVDVHLTQHNANIKVPSQYEWQ